jgi:membrane-associated phospholipid phosphatase
MPCSSPEGIGTRILPVGLALLLLFLGGTTAGAGSKDLETAGDIGYYALPIAALGMAIANKDPEGAKQFAFATLSTAAVTEGLKLAVNEQAPDGADHSFPSGHASIAFSSAAFVQIRYGWTYGIPAYLVAAFVGYTRVATDQHYVHDVLAGAAIGILANVIFTSPYCPVTVVPAVGRDSIGVVVTRSF